MKRYCNAFGTWSSPSTTHSNHFKKQDRNFTSLVALIFLPDLMFHYLIFHLPNFMIALIKLCKVDLLTIHLGISVEDKWITILQNISRCLLLNDKQMPHEYWNTKLNKDEHTRIERTEIWNKSKRNRASCLNILLDVFAFLSNTVEEGRW